MDLQAYLKTHFSGNRTILVGNAPFSRNSSERIDGYDLVIRFNLFAKPWFREGRSGSKLDYWFTNLDRSAESLPQRRKHAELAAELNPECVIGTAHENDKHGRLPPAIEFYLQYGKSLVYPDSSLPTRFLGTKQPSTGFYAAYRLVQAGVAVTVIGFTGGVNDRWHNGPAEIEWLQSQPELVNFDADF